MNNGAYPNLEEICDGVITIVMGCMMMKAVLRF